MQNDSTAADTTNQPNYETPAGQGADVDATEKRLPFADGGFGPLDSDDIEWLIEHKQVWLP